MAGQVEVVNLSSQPIFLRHRTRRSNKDAATDPLELRIEARGLGLLPCYVHPRRFGPSKGSIELCAAQDPSEGAGSHNRGTARSWAGVVLPKRLGTWQRLELEADQHHAGGNRRASEHAEKQPLLDETAKGPKSDRNGACSRVQLFAKRMPSDRWKMLVLPAVSPAEHLTGLDDQTSIADLILPATHNTLALHGYPVSKCQDSDCMLDTQRREGIRFVDIRIAERNGVLLAYHGPFPQLVPFRDMLREAYAFLAAHPRETFVFCIMQEAPPSARFSPLVRADMQDGIDRGLWFLENRIPLLGEVRGKIILMSRFGGNNDGGNGPWMVKESGVDVLRRGWAPYTWPNSEIEGFEWDCGGTTVRIQDWYDIYGFFNIPAKTNVLTDHLARSASMPPGSNMCISFASATSFPLALPPFVAKGLGWPSWGLGYYGVNERLRNWVLDQICREGSEVFDTKTAGAASAQGYWRLRGAIPMDFYRSAQLIDVLIAYNDLYTEEA